MSQIVINEKFISGRTEIKKNTTDKQKFVSVIKKEVYSREIKVNINNQSGKKVIFRKK